MYDTWALAQIAAQHAAEVDWALGFIQPLGRYSKPTLTTQEAENPCGPALNEGYTHVECQRSQSEFEAHGCAYCPMKFQYDPDARRDYWLDTRYAGEDY